MNLTQQRTVAIVGLAAILFAGGCNPTVFTPNQNDELRRQVRDLDEQVNAAKAKQVELEQQLAQSAKSAEEKSSIDPAILAATPHVASVQIGGSSPKRSRRPRGSDRIVMGVHDWCAGPITSEIWLV